jgi:hypothetical protein
MVRLKWYAKFLHVNPEREPQSVIENFRGYNIHEVKYCIEACIDRMREWGYVIEDQEIMDITEEK